MQLVRFERNKKKQKKIKETNDFSRCYYCTGPLSGLRQLFANRFLLQPSLSKWRI